VAKKKVYNKKIKKLSNLKMGYEMENVCMGRLKTKKKLKGMTKDKIKIIRQ
jgi:hypothetical protein